MGLKELLLADWGSTPRLGQYTATGTTTINDSDDWEEWGYRQGLLLRPLGGIDADKRKDNSGFWAPQVGWGEPELEAAWKRGWERGVREAVAKL